MNSQIDVARVMRGVAVALLTGFLAACQARVDAEEPAAVAEEQPAATEEQPDAVDASESILQTVQMMDPAGFGSPVVAGTVQIPAGWHAEGGITWDRSGECVNNYLRPKWRASSKDGAEAFELMPGYTWQVAGTQVQLNPCPVLGVRTARQFLQIVAQRYPGVRELEYRERPDLLPKNPQAMNGATARNDVGEMLIGYVRDGREVQELILAMLNITEMQGNVMVGVPAVYAQRAPKGRLDRGLGERIRQSIQTNREWLAMMTKASAAAIERISQNQRAAIASWHAREMGRINAQGAMDRSRIAMQTSREVAQIYSDGWQRTQDMGDRIQRRTLETIGGYNTYNDPAGGGVVRESIGYDRVLRTEDGNYISTNDPYLNPAGSQELERIP